MTRPRRGACTSGRAALVVAVVAVVAVAGMALGVAACGRYGPPVREPPLRAAPAAPARQPPDAAAREASGPTGESQADPEPTPEQP